MDYDLDKFAAAALDTWGKHAQIDQLKEELFELGLVASHVNRGRRNCLDNFIEEIADVELMCYQMRVIIDQLCKEQYTAWNKKSIGDVKKEKIARTVGKIKLQDYDVYCKYYKE